MESIWSGDHKATSLAVSLWQISSWRKRSGIRRHDSVYAGTSEWFCRGSIPRWDCATIYGRYPAALHLRSFQWIVYYVTVDSAKHENLKKVGTRFLLVHLSLFSSTKRTLLHSTTPSHTLTLYLPICPFLRRLCNNTRLITANIPGMTLTMSSGLCAFIWTGSLLRHLRIFVSNQSCFSNTWFISQL